MHNRGGREHNSPGKNLGGSSDIEYNKETGVAAQAATTTGPDENAQIKRGKVILASNQGTVHSTKNSTEPKGSSNTPFKTTPKEKA